MININFLNTIIDEAIDDDIFKKIGHEQFFYILNKAKIDLDDLAFKKKKNDYIPFHRFNFILKELHEKKEVDITDSCVYVLTQMLTLKDLMGCLNEENKYTLRTSLAQRNNILVKRPTLDGYTFKKKKKSKKTISPKNI